MVMRFFIPCVIILQKAVCSKLPPLYYYPRRIDASSLSKTRKYGMNVIVELMITDNQALTVQNTLRQLGFPVTVKRQTHWEIQCDSAATSETNQTKRCVI